MKQEHLGVACKNVESSAVVFIGSTLSQFFLNDPSAETLRQSFTAVEELDIDAAAQEWPFVEASRAQEGLALMREGALQRLGDDGAIEKEYRRLFVGPQALPIPPWGSVYTDRDCVVFGESTLALRAWMRSKGIERPGDGRDPDDHIGLMLALLSWIAEAKPELLSDFLRLHLLPWSGHMLSMLEEAAEHPFYKGLAFMANVSLEGMGEALGLSVEKPRFYR